MESAAVHRRRGAGSSTHGQGSLTRVERKGARSSTARRRLPSFEHNGRLSAGLLPLIAVLLVVGGEWLALVGAFSWLIVYAVDLVGDSELALATLWLCVVVNMAGHFYNCVFLFDTWALAFASAAIHAMILGLVGAWGTLNCEPLADEWRGLTLAIERLTFATLPLVATPLLGWVALAMDGAERMHLYVGCVAAALFSAFGAPLKARQGDLLACPRPAAALHLVAAVLEGPLTFFLMHRGAPSASAGLDLALAAGLPLCICVWTAPFGAFWWLRRDPWAPPGAPEAILELCLRVAGILPVLVFVDQRVVHGSLGHYLVAGPEGMRGLTAAALAAAGLPLTLPAAWRPAPVVAVFHGMSAASAAAAYGLPLVLSPLPAVGVVAAELAALEGSRRPSAAALALAAGAAGVIVSMAAFARHALGVVVFDFDVAGWRVDLQTLAALAVVTAALAVMSATLVTYARRVSKRPAAPLAAARACALGHLPCLVALEGALQAAGPVVYPDYVVLATTVAGLVAALFLGAAEDRGRPRAGSAAQLAALTGYASKSVLLLPGCRGRAALAAWLWTWASTFTALLPLVAVPEKSLHPAQAAAAIAACTIASLGARRPATASALDLVLGWAPQPATVVAAALIVPAVSAAALARRHFPGGGGSRAARKAALISVVVPIVIALLQPTMEVDALVASVIVTVAHPGQTFTAGPARRLVLWPPWVFVAVVVASLVWTAFKPTADGPPRVEVAVMSVLAASGGAAACGAFVAPPGRLAYILVAAMCAAQGAAVALAQRTAGPLGRRLAGHLYGIGVALALAISGAPSHFLAFSGRHRRLGYERQLQILTLALSGGEHSQRAIAEPLAVTDCAPRDSRRSLEFSSRLCREAGDRASQPGGAQAGLAPAA